MWSIKLFYVLMLTECLVSLVFFYYYNSILSSLWLRGTQMKISGDLIFKTTPSTSLFDEWNKLNLSEVPIVPETNCTASFFTVGEGGRLGNILCQFITSIRFRIKYGVRIAIVANYRKDILDGLFESLPAPSKKTPCFNSSNMSYLALDNYEMDLYFRYRKYLTKNGYKLTHKNKEATHYHIPMYPCPLIPYLTDYRSKIRKVLPLRRDLMQEAKKRIERSLQDLGKERSNVDLISVHVRRTDYLKEMIERNSSAKIPTINHYIKAFNFFRNRCKSPLFLVLSDDYVWAKEHLNFSDVIFPGDANIGSPRNDFAIIASCDHHIYGIGTFGAMSAFFGIGSVVFFPEFFHANTLEEADKIFNCSSSQIYIHMTI